MGQFGSPRAANPQTARFQPPKPMGQPMMGQKPPGGFGGFKPPPSGGGLQGGGFNAAGVNAGLVNGANLFTPGAYQQAPQQGGSYGGGGMQGMASTLEGINARRAGGEAMTPWDMGGRAAEYANYQRGQRPGADWDPGRASTAGRSFADLLGGFGGYGAPAGGGSQGQSGITAGPGGYNIPGLINQQQPAPQFQAPQPGLGPNDGPPDFNGMSGSDIFARLFQRP
jgi:hypothetical protein